MAVELISKILSPTNATYVNGVSAQRKFSEAILKNMFQGLVEKDNRGVNEKYVTEDDAVAAGQVFVNRIIPVAMKPREQGSSKNGASFSANKHYTQTETVGIELLTYLDDPIIIPRARQEMIPTDLLAEQIEIFSKRLSTIINGATAASHLVEVWLADAAGQAVNEKVISSSDVSNKEVLNRFIEANSLLDEGDSAHGIDLFPEDTRVAVIKPSYRAILKTSGVLVLGGANYVYDIAKGGAISHDSTPSKSEDGYVGEIDGVPCHILSNESLRHASEFLGLTPTDLKDSAFIGYITSSYANARGVSTTGQTKVVDAIDGQGVVLQPFVKFGVKTFYSKGVVVLKSESGYSQLKELKSLFSGATVSYKLKAAGSRLYPSVPSTAWSSVSTSGFTLSGITALDDFNTDHYEAGAWYVASAAPTTVGEFLKGYSTASEKGAITLASAESFDSTQTAGHYVCALLIADDGSCSLASVVIPA